MFKCAQYIMFIMGIIPQNNMKISSININPIEKRYSLSKRALKYWQRGLDHILKSERYFAIFSNIAKRKGDYIEMESNKYDTCSQKN